MFITSFEEQNITYRSCSNLRIHLCFYIEATPDSFFYLLKAHIGYNTSIKFNTAGTLPWGFGLNFIELIMFLLFRKILKEILQQT
ncbi:hypothetical protein C9E88_000470 [Acinetobacter cumulans]|nr:hypothetical protein C9E88_000470 [Acinetobacter cumulans]